MDNYRKLFMVITLSVGSVLFFYFNGTSVVQPHITELHQYVYQLTNYSLLPDNNSNTDSLISFESVKQDIPVKNKTIVMLNTPRWLAQRLPTKHIFDKCEVSACRFHYKKPFQYINDSDAVILYAVGFSSKINFIRRPKDGQIWIFAAWESPYFSNSQEFDKAIFKDKINWTMSYRLDSDIPVPYASLKKTSGLSINYTKIMTEKTKLAAQVVSHCPTPSLRERYVQTLEKYIPVTVYGRCGPTKKRSPDKHLFQNIEKSYKFYLAFENSLCRDYVTEKFFNWQNRSIVPIVRGDGNYEHFYPKNSFIDVRDFKSISDLAKYIQYLDRNDTAYIEYLEAKGNVVVTTIGVNHYIKSLCQVCKMIHNPDKYRNNYSNVQDWYTNGSCRIPIDLEIKIVR